MHAKKGKKVKTNEIAQGSRNLVRESRNNNKKKNQQS
jgi:hypothetical protein